MRALCWHGINDLRVDTVPEPEIVSPRDAILRVSLSTTCGSDLHFIDGYIPTMRHGDIIGHEFCGEVVEVGTVAILGVYGIMDKFPVGIMMNKGLTIRTAQQHGQKYVPTLLRHIENGDVDPSYLATHHFSLNDAPRPYDMFKSKSDGILRAVFAP